MCVVDTDYGCGVIRKGKPVPMTVNHPESLDYSFLENNRKEVLNLLSVEAFLNS